MSITNTNGAFGNRTRNLPTCIYKIYITQYTYCLLSVRFFYICDGSVGTVNNYLSFKKKRMCRRGKTVIYYVIFYVWVLACSFFDGCANLK